MYSTAPKQLPGSYFIIVVVQRYISQLVLQLVRVAIAIIIIIAIATYLTMYFQVLTVKTLVIIAKRLYLYA